MKPATLFMLIALAACVLASRGKKLTRIPLDKQNRMLRVGFGKHNGTWFFRADLWFVGVRIS